MEKAKTSWLSSRKMMKNYIFMKFTFQRNESNVIFHSESIVKFIESFIIREQFV